jgi:hypothetical protein
MPKISNPSPVIEVSGRKLYDIKVLFKGTNMPVAVYLVKDNSGRDFNLCICFENSPIETRMAIDITEKGWIDIYDDSAKGSELAEAIGAQIMNKINEHAKLN